MVNVTDTKLGTVTRKSFSHSKFSFELPNLVEVQTKSYQWFLDVGLNEVLRDASPIEDFARKYSIEFLSYELAEKPKYTVEECKEHDANYAKTLFVTVRMTNLETNEVIDRKITLGEMPIMTETGTFVINGAERVIVSQILRSPGMYFSRDKDKGGRDIFAAQIIPYRGAWLEFEIDANGMALVKIDKNKKVPLTMFLRAIAGGNLNTREAVFDLFGDEKAIRFTLDHDESETLSVTNHSTPEVEALKEIYKKLRPGEPPLEDSARTQLNNYFFDPKRYDIAKVGRYKFNKKMALHSRIRGLVLAEDAVSPETGELLFEAGHRLTNEEAHQVENSGINKILVKAEDGAEVIVLSNNTVYPEHILGFDLVDCGVNEKADIDTLIDIREKCEGDVERAKEMAKARIAELCPKCLTVNDIFAATNYILGLAHGIGSVDDIDHLGNRRIRAVGEQLQQSLRNGFVRMEKNIRERMGIQEDGAALEPKNIINNRPVVAALREFFGSSQLSQFMDQNNPLAELTHKRRLSALGPGGLTRDRASFDVRDVHYTQYGRMCPIETPEGPNIGLISYLTTYARINDYGFIEAPFRKIDKATGKVTDEVEYMTADVEDNYTVVPANEPLNEDGSFKNARLTARHLGEFIEIPAENADYMDVAPKMVVSVATGSIPFLENDDNSRALMGSNMQKQAVPLMTTVNPIVATGMEYKAAVDSGVVVVAKEDGVVDYVDARRIVIRDEKNAKHEYELIKFKRTNQNTCFNQRPIVNCGDRVMKGQVIADGPATSQGEISLGKNALIGFMTWEGYNYEDAVLLNERLVRDDVYTSLHIEEFTHEARDTKQGPEEITCEIPNVGEDALKNLDADGVIRVGTEVRAGDILVGKVTPKGETEMTAEEKLLHAIFGEKAKEVRDTSLRLPHGETGIVVDVKTFSRADGYETPNAVNKVVRVYIAQKRKISVGDKMAGRHGNKGVVSRILPPEDMPFLADGTPLDIVLNPLGVPSRMNIGQVLEVHLGIAARKLGWKVMTPVFDGANERDIIECLRMAGYCRDIRPNENVDNKDLFVRVKLADGKIDLQKVPDEIRADKDAMAKFRAENDVVVVDGKTTLYDGRTGEPFDNPVTVGIMYYLKLHHLVDDKIHARSNGPYSLITQQPLGGKAQFGGQRFGEMEVWALEAYGAAYTLQEILTVKSDDVNGRRQAYEAIIKGQNIPTPGTPESFKVLVKELQSLCLDVRVLDKDGKEINLANVTSDANVTPYSNRVKEMLRNGGLGGEDEDDEEGEDGEDVELDEEYVVDENEVYGNGSVLDEDGIEQ